jgi:hypothetical protein
MSNTWVLSNPRETKNMVSYMSSKCLRSPHGIKCEYENGIDLITGEYDNNNKLKKLSRSIIFSNGGPTECFSPSLWECDKTARGEWQCIQRNDASSHIAKIEDFARDSQ